MEEGEQLAVTNVNDLWNKNWFENIQNAENFERLIRTGGSGPDDYITIPKSALPSKEFRLIMNEAKYINLINLANELDMLLTDITPVIGEDKLKEFIKHLDLICHDLQLKDKYIIIKFSADGIPFDSTLTPLFNSAKDYLINCRREIIKTMTPLLYVSKPKQEW